MAKLIKATKARTAQLEVYVPNSDRYGVRYFRGPSGGSFEYEGHAHAAWVERIETAVCALPGGGGCSTYDVEGSWGHVCEATRVVRATVVVDADNPLGVGLQALVDVLDAFGRLTDQAAVGLTLDGVWWYVSGDVSEGASEGATKSPG